MRKKPKYQPGGFRLRVGNSRAGKGMFTDEKIPKGVCIIEYTGNPATPAQIKADRGKYLFEISETLTIDGNIPSNKARFINHSCAPNCEIEIYKSRVYVFSKRAIRAGEELSYDYDTEYFLQHIYLKGCICLKCSPITPKAAFSPSKSAS